jgi:hypothetical protein
VVAYRGRCSLADTVCLLWGWCHLLQSAWQAPLLTCWVVSSWRWTSRNPLRRTLLKTLHVEDPSLGDTGQPIASAFPQFEHLQRHSMRWPPLQHEDDCVTMPADLYSSVWLMLLWQLTYTNSFKHRLSSVACTCIVFDQ